MTARYLGRAFFITKGEIVRLKIGRYGSNHFKSYFREDDNFYEAVVNELTFFAQNDENLFAKVFFKQVASNLDQTSRFFKVCKKLAANNSIPL